MEFHGVKVALIFKDKLVMQHRDNKPGLLNSNMWDFPGGGREGNETPVECALREIQEEFGIKLEASSFVWQKDYPAQKDPNQRAFFLVANISKENVDAIHFGNEGQGWDFMDYNTFFERSDVVEAIKGRFRDYLDKK